MKTFREPILKKIQLIFLLSSEINITKLHTLFFIVKYEM